MKEVNVTNNFNLPSSPPFIREHSLSRFTIKIPSAFKSCEVD
jgi:hypothetical protein